MVAVVEAPVSEREVRTYQEDGAACLRRLVDRSWVDRLRRAIERLEKNPGPFAERYSPQDPGTFLSEKFMWTFDPDFRAYIFESGVAEAAGRLMGAAKINMFYDHLMVKDPGAVSPTPWHQDLNYWPVEGRQVCSIWLALDRVGPENGQVEFVAGSHLWKSRYQPFDFRGTAAVETDEFEKLPDVEAHRGDYRIVSWELEPGDAVAFSALTLHGARGNATTDSRRRALSVRFCGEDVRFVRRKKMIKLLRDPGLEPGDELDCDLFPVLWRRPS
jgi:ectoine hydroxylase-related dioxygenase (phytanoyl-CoA dioxygenase family)